MTDATFEDGGEQPLRLMTEDTEDLAVISSLVQDAVFPASEMTWQRSARRFALLLNRFRWEDRSAAERRGRAYERVQSVLVIDDVKGVQSQGVQKGDSETVLSLLSISFDAGENGAGHVILYLAGDGAIRLDVECLNVTLKDVTRPYIAPSKAAPTHPE